MPTPDWVMLGTSTGDGRFAVWASKDLTRAELRREVEYPDWDVLLHRFGTTATRHELTVEMRAYVVVVGDTYGDALRRLFDVWSPDADRLALAGRQETEGGPNCPGNPRQRGNRP